MTTRNALPVPKPSSGITFQGQAGRQLRSVNLFDGTTEVFIEHYGSLYVLRELPSGDLRLELMDDSRT